LDVLIFFENLVSNFFFDPLFGVVAQYLMGARRENLCKRPAATGPAHYHHAMTKSIALKPKGYRRDNVLHLLSIDAGSMLEL
jgi:hypothetical protein